MKRPIPLGSLLKKQQAFSYHQAMRRAVLTSLVGLMLSIGGGASAFASGEVIWEGTEEPKFSLFGKKERRIKITSNGVFINGIFRGPNALSYEELCRYTMWNFPTNQWSGAKPIRPKGTGWYLALEQNESGTSTNCDAIRIRATHDFIYRKTQAVVRRETSGLNALSTSRLCNLATQQGRWETRAYYLPHVKEAKRRGLTCGVDQSSPTQVATNSPTNAELMAAQKREDLSALNDTLICNAARLPNAQQWSNLLYAKEAIARALDCGISNSVEKFIASGGSLSKVHSNPDVVQRVGTSAQTNPTRLGKFTDEIICNAARLPGKNYWLKNKYRQEAERRGLACGINDASPKKAAISAANNAELLAAQNRAAELEKRVALLEAKEELAQRQIASDNQAPLIAIIQSGANGREGYLTGSVTDNVQVAEVLVDGTPVSIAKNGSFAWTGFVPPTGKDIVVEAIDTAALASRQVVRLERGQIAQAIGPTFDDLNPMAGRRALQNKNALALIVGISDYERTDAPAVYADKDAQYFHDYASLKLGIPDQNITTLVNDKAEQGDVFLAVADWMRRSSKPGKSDIYIFFAGHGLASQDGEQMYLLPYDGRPRLLDKTAILRDELFTDIAAANPRSVTVFLDTCYSGTTRGPDMLIASRPIAIRVKGKAVPEGFTVMTAAAGDQTAKPLEEAKHGMFSYFLMKGMEGEADANSDHQITAGELQEYVYQNVVQQSSGSQTPELQGDADRVLVRFQ